MTEKLFEDIVSKKMMLVPLKRAKKIGGLFINLNMVKLFGDIVTVDEIFSVHDKLTIYKIKEDHHACYWNAAWFSPCHEGPFNMLKSQEGMCQNTNLDINA